MGRRLGGFGVCLALALLVGPGGVAAPLSPVLGRGDVDQMRVERRIALVIGNGAYGPTIGPLANPTNDARAIAATLKGLGFEVTVEVDADRDRMRRAVIDFGLALRAGGVGLFYYSGHAVQLDGVNYMIPLNADVVSASYLSVETVPVEEVLARMGGADNRLNIVILDSCRNNPFKGIFRGSSRGLAQTPAPSGTYIAYAAAPDARALDGTGDPNSPYTAALLDALTEPGLSLEDVFKRVRGQVRARTNGFQTPWTGSSITGDFFFRLPEPARPATLPAPPPAAGAPIDMLVWNAIQNSQEPSDFETFLETYPDSPLAPFARNRLKTLQNVGAPSRTRQGSQPPDWPVIVSTLVPGASALPAEPAPVAGRAPVGPVVAAVPPTPEPVAEQAEPAALAPDPAAIEAALDLSRDQSQEIQVALTALGHDTHGIDGLLGPNSRAALSRWQQAEGEAGTGYLTEPQRVTLLEAAKTAVAEWRQRPKPGREFRDCADCPLMVVVPAGTFLMGSPQSELGHSDDEGPQHQVTIRQPFAVGKYELTFAEWDACAAAGGCNGYQPNDEAWGRGRRPVINVSWNDAQIYVAWLSAKTGESYRVLSEAEWEYAARAGTATPFHTGATISPAQANYDGNYTYGAGRRGQYRGQTLPVGSLAPNEFGLHDVHGNVSEWVEDCWNESYRGAPDYGSARTDGECRLRVLRGGSWALVPAILRSANRLRNSADSSSPFCRGPARQDAFAQREQYRLIGEEGRKRGEKEEKGSDSLPRRACAQTGRSSN